MKLIASLLLVGLLSLSGCATMQDVQKTLGTPQAVQADITIIGGLAASKIPADAKAKIHAFAIQLSAAADLNLDALFALIPTTGSQNGDALISAAKAYLTVTVQKYGANNATALAYAKAIANGLLANF